MQLDLTSEVPASPEGTESVGSCFAIVTGTDPGEKTTFERIRWLKERYHIEDHFIADNQCSRRGGVFVNHVGEADAGQLTITSRTKITAANNALYKANTDI